MPNGAGNPARRGVQQRLGLWVAAVVAAIVPLSMAAPVGDDRIIASAQFSVAFFATILTGEAVIFALAFSASSAWPSLREIDAHIAFRAPDHDAIRKFHAAGLKAGGRDNGAAGPRADYSPTYFAAFLIDPDGNNVEAVCM